MPALKAGQQVHIVCAPQHAGSVCRNVGYGPAATHVLHHPAPSATVVYVSGHVRPFTLRTNGRWVRQRSRADDGPYLEEAR